MYALCLPLDEYTTPAATTATTTSTKALRPEHQSGRWLALNTSKCNCLTLLCFKT